MPSRQHPELILIYILISVDKISRRTKSLTFSQFIEDEMVYGFTLRELSDIGENVKRLLDTQFLQKSPSIDWRKIVDFRNVVVHKYFGIVPEMVAEIVEKEIPILRENVINLLQQQDDKTLFYQALQDTREIYLKMKRHETVAFLDNIKMLIL